MCVSAHVIFTVLGIYFNLFVCRYFLMMPI